MSGRKTITVLGWTLLVTTVGTILAGINYPVMRVIPLLIVLIANLVLLLGFGWYRWKAAQQQDARVLTVPETVMFVLVLMALIVATLWYFFQDNQAT